MKWQGIINGLLGIWLIISAFLNGSASFNLWNYLLVGAVVTILAFWGASEKKA